MIDLPIDGFIPDVLAALASHANLVLVAEPGAGKTTRVPPALLGLLSPEHPSWVMLQPRRVAARASAQRIASENQWQLGGPVGYQVRMESCLSADTRLRVITEGILTRQLLEDPFLTGVGGVILDEFHERSIHTDVALAMLREIQQSVRPDLRILVMSATLAAEPVAAFLGNAPILRVPGRTFPIQTHQVGRGEVLPRQIAALMERLLEKPEEQTGDFLVFLPGAEEIRRTARELEGAARRWDLELVPLYGALSFDEQQRALRRATKRRAILATNLAETSLTIEGVRTVIDSGLARVAEYDPQRGVDRLELRRISRASALQRAGRAGRTSPGEAYQLWSSADERQMSDFLEPEIHRVDLCGLLLTLHGWGNPASFGWFDAPASERVIAGELLLYQLGALTAPTGGKLTPTGQKMLRWPTHPRLARLLLQASQEGLIKEGATLAALLAEKDLLRGGPQRVALTVSPSDLLVRMEWLEEAERNGFRDFDGPLDMQAARQIARARDELLRSASGRARGERSTPEALLKLLLWAYPDRVVRRRTADPRTGTMVGGRGVRLAPESMLEPSADFFLALDARDERRSGTREALVRMASAIQLPWLQDCFPHQCRRSQELAFDPQRQRVVSLRRDFFADLVLDEDPHGQVEASPQAADILAREIRPQAAAWFEEDEKAREWLTRLHFLQRSMPEHPWPVFSPELLADLLAQACQGRRSVEELRRVSLVELLKVQLDWNLLRQMDLWAPETLTIPSGRHGQLTYQREGAPILAVRLQELFGLAQTPRVAGGRVPILLHLLSPASRPVQVTDDLASFWQRAYFEVRKDLRVRYPKHRWPENPLEAEASKPRR